MIQVEQLHYKFKVAYNRLSNSYRKSFSDVEIDEILNTAVFEYVELFYNGSNKNNWNVGFEVTQQRIDMLHTLVKSYPEQPSLNLSLNDGVYWANLNHAAFPFKSFQAAYLTVNDCAERPLDLSASGRLRSPQEVDINVDLEQHQDLYTARQNTHRKSSLRWKRCIGTIRDKKLYLYPDGAFVPIKAYLTYIKKPNEICLGTYPSIENKNIPNAPLKTKTDCDLPEDYIDILVAIAVQEVHRRYSNYNDLQVSQQKITTTV